MADTTSESDRIMRAASQSLDANRNGGVHRRAASIGKGSANAKLKTWIKRGGYFALAVFAIMTAASIIGVILNGIGFVGVMAVAMAIMCAAVFFSQFPKVKIPKRSELKQGNPKQMVARVELWLENQRAGLPPMAAALVEKMGGQLDALGAQLESMDDAHPAMSEVRELVGDYIPETIDNYRKIPEHLRSEEHAGGTADARLVESLTKLSGELDRVTRRLAEGAMDDLAVKSRYLDYRFGSDDLLEDASGMPDTGVPLPDMTPATKAER
ncbi:hypothetical protein INR77_03515 [Erythrobacter sp. SCSIO 43205]|uniref:hypothetical protein n=1 Tax=Erythrobacter sp. SCSIO 43205 TaxID=2779361 RepID=UPI001CA8A503|nr:hypothetical protein [Erythrobacter sp. SCSIO 43205]UAB78800.1 hypothetical protein INR77_03515 [Erythrobacter sp. SCSIO 43205]